MNKSKIEWTDYTWNPVTGCLHGCEYCYARRIANRFCRGTGKDDKKIHEVNNKMYDEWIIKEGEYGHRQDPYPYGFEPTFHRYRLNEPAKVKKPSKIFVCSMADLFGDWVPDKWIEEVFKACEEAPQHKYLFLTKNPKRYVEMAKANKLPKYKNFWYGSTTTTPEAKFFYSRNYNTFISIEPLLAEFESIGDQNRHVVCDWVIIGQQTGPRALYPEHRWVKSIIDQCRAAGVPVFVKPPLFDIFPIQEWPEGLK